MSKFDQKGDQIESSFLTGTMCPHAKDPENESIGEWVRSREEQDPIGNVWSNTMDP